MHVLCKQCLDKIHTKATNTTEKNLPQTLHSELQSDGQTAEETFHLETVALKITRQNHCLNSER